MKALICLIFAVSCFGGERITLSGSVTDADGKPVERATVFVYSARVKKGYSPYCPTCWADCGKHVATDAQGKYSIEGLNSDLIFTLIALRDGFVASQIQDANANGEAVKTAVLKPRPEITEAQGVVRGRVVDAQGDPVRDAVVQQDGIAFRTANGNVTNRYGPSSDWIDPLAVTNSNGDFEMAYGKPAAAMILEVQPRGMAGKLFNEPTGLDRKTMVVTDGATIRGRLMHNGKPVANAEVGLITYTQNSGSMFNEMRIGTDASGRFSITNVPAGRIWSLYPKMESLASREIGARPLVLETKDDGEVVQVGDVELTPSYTLRGRIRLKDGRAIPADTHATLSQQGISDTQIATVHEDGSFEFRGIPRGVYDVASVIKGYRITNSSSTLTQLPFTEILVDRNRDNVVLEFEPRTR